MCGAVLLPGNGSIFLWLPRWHMQRRAGVPWQGSHSLALVSAHPQWAPVPPHSFPVEQTGRGSACSLASLGGFPAWQPGEPQRPAGTAGGRPGGGGSQRGARGMGLSAWRSRPGVKGPRGSSSPRAICSFSAPAPTPGLSHPAPGSPPPSEVSNGQWQRKSSSICEERSHVDGSPVDVIVLITAHLHFITRLSQMPHYCWKGFSAGELLANYSFLGSDVTRQADWKRRGEEEPKRGEGEKGLLSDLIKGRDLNRYLIKWLLPHHTGNSPCSQNRD